MGGGTAVQAPISCRAKVGARGAVRLCLIKRGQTLFQSCEPVRAWREQSGLRPCAGHAGSFRAFPPQKRAGHKGGAGDGMPVTHPSAFNRTMQTSRKPPGFRTDRPAPSPQGRIGVPVANASSTLRRGGDDGSTSPRQLRQHVMPVVEILVEALDRDPLVLAVRAFIVGNDDPRSVNAIDRHARRPEN